MKREDLLDENIFDNPRFPIDDEQIAIKMYKCKNYGTTKVTDISDGNGKHFRTKYDLERTCSLQIQHLNK